MHGENLKLNFSCCLQSS